MMEKEERRTDIEKNLSRLSEMTGYEVAEKNPDVRGWNVYSSEGTKFGNVVDLIIDPEAMKVRYLDVEVDEGIQGVSSEHRLLVPVGVASIDEKEDKIYIKTIETVTLLKTPPYKGGEITRDYEDQLRKSFGDESGNEPAEDNRHFNYYTSKYYDDSYFYGSRRRDEESFAAERKKEEGTAKDSGEETVMELKNGVRHPLVLSAGSVKNANVVNRKGEDLGKIEELAVDVNHGKIAYGVLSFGGFLGIGDKYFAIPWELLNFDPGKYQFSLDIEKDKLKNAPGFDKDNWPNSADYHFISNVYKYYDCDAYWSSK